MRDIAEMTVAQIEVTNACHLRCANCTRHVGHHKKPYFMNLKYIEKAIDSLEGFPGRIGMMGGEPAMHPQFLEIIKIYEKKIPRRKRQIWTAGHKWNEFKDEIERVFDKDLINYNDHTAPGKHQPLLVSIDEVLENKDLVHELIDNCWVQEQWSASITPRGGFFCEVAASLDQLMDGPGGCPIEKNWWKKPLEDFQNQINSYCKKCSAALPLPSESDGYGGRTGPTVDIISEGNYQLLKDKSLKIEKGNYKIYNKKITDKEIIKNSFGWAPSKYRGFISHSEEMSSEHRLISKSEKIKAR
jgi:hypothetical protein